MVASPFSRHIDDARPQPLDHGELDRQVGLQLLAHGLADPQGAQPLVVGQAFEEQDAVGDLLRMLHLVDRLVARVRGELGQAPVLLHLRVQEVLVDRGELARELLVEEGDDFGIATHGVDPSARIW